MKPVKYYRHYNQELMRDTFIVLTPPILTLIGILWFLSDVPTQVTNVVVSFVDSILALLTSAA